MYDKGKLIKLHYIYRYVKQRTAQFENPAIFWVYIPIHRYYIRYVPAYPIHSMQIFKL